MNKRHSPSSPDYQTPTHVPEADPLKLHPPAEHVAVHFDLPVAFDPSPEPPVAEAPVFDEDIYSEMTFWEWALAAIICFFTFEHMAQYKERRYFRHIARQLNHDVPNAFILTGSYLGTGMQYIIYNMWQNTIILKQLFQHTLHHPSWLKGHQDASSLYERFFLSVIGIPQQIVDNILSYNNISPVIETHNMLDTTRSIRQKIMEVIESAPKQWTLLLDDQYPHLLCLDALTQFDFVYLLERFDPNMQKAEVPQFQPFPVQPLEYPLQELQRLVCAVHTQMDMDPLLKPLLDANVAVDPSITTGALQHALDNLLELVSVLQTTQAIPRILRLAKHAKRLETTPLQDPVPYTTFPTYQASLDDHIARCVQTTLRINNHKIFKNVWQRWFPKETITYIGFYTPDFIPETLECDGYFAYADHLVLIDKFLTKLYDPLLSPLLRKLSEQGQFRDKRLLYMLQEHFHSMENLAKTFSSQLGPLQRDSTIGAQITKLIPGPMNAQTMHSLRQCIQHANQQAHQTLLLCQQHLPSLLKVTQSLSASLSKKGTPTITNAVSIIGGHSEEHTRPLEHLVATMQAISDFLQRGGSS